MPLLSIGHKAGKAKVAELHPSIFADENVGWLHIAVEYATAMGVSQCLGDGDAKANHFLYRGEYVPVGTLALDQFHCEPCRCRITARRKDLHDVWMMELGDRTGLFWAGVRTANRHDFDRDIASQRDLPRHIHRAHAAATKEGNDLKIWDFGRDERLFNRRRAEARPSYVFSAKFVKFCRQTAQVVSQFFLKHETSTSFFCRRSNART